MKKQKMKKQTIYIVTVIHDDGDVGAVAFTTLIDARGYADMMQNMCGVDLTEIIKTHLNTTFKN